MKRGDPVMNLDFENSFLHLRDDDGKDESFDGMSGGREREAVSGICMRVSRRPVVVDFAVASLRQLRRVVSTLVFQLRIRLAVPGWRWKLGVSFENSSSALVSQEFLTF